MSLFFEQYAEKKRKPKMAHMESKSAVFCTPSIKDGTKMEVCRELSYKPQNGSPMRPFWPSFFSVYQQHKVTKKKRKSSVRALNLTLLVHN